MSESAKVVELEMKISGLESELETVRSEVKARLGELESLRSEKRELETRLVNVNVSKVLNFR